MCWVSQVLDRLEGLVSGGVLGYRLEGPSVDNCVPPVVTLVMRPHDGLGRKPSCNLTYGYTGDETS